MYLPQPLLIGVCFCSILATVRITLLRRCQAAEAATCSTLSARLARAWTPDTHARTARQ